MIMHNQLLYKLELMETNHFNQTGKYHSRLQQQGLIHPKIESMKKTFILFLLAVSTLLISCSKEIESSKETTKLTPTELKQIFDEKGIDLPITFFESSLRSESSSTTCYNTNDVLNFLTFYGSSVEDIIPTIPNDYFQDANCNVAKWTAGVRKRNPIDSTTLSTSSIPINITWEIQTSPSINTGSDFAIRLYTYIQDSLGNITINENCPGITSIPCNGAQSCIITMEFVDGSIYQRSGTIYGQINNTPDEIQDCEGVQYTTNDLSYYDFECNCPIQFEKNQFLIYSGLTWDLNGDGSIDTLDILILLMNYGNC